MRRLLAVIVLLTLVGWVGATLTTPPMNYAIEGQTSATRQKPYIVLNTVTADDTALTAATKYWDVLDSPDTRFLAIEPTWSRVEIAFYCYGDGTGDGDPNAATFDFKIYAVRPYGCAKTVYQGYGQCGELELSCSPINGTQYNSGALDANQSYKWVDTIDPNGTGNSGRWMSSVVLSGDAGTDTAGEMATVSLDLNGYYGLWCEITNMTSKPVTQIWAVVSGY